MKTSDKTDLIFPALLKAKAQFRPAVKDSTNPHFKSKYVSLDAVIDAISEALAANELLLMQPTRVEDAQTILETIIVHKSGQYVSGDYPVHPVKADPQGEGSALTYARRYALMGMVGIAPEDDDGNAAVKASYATEAEQVTLQEWIEATGSDVSKFLKAFNAESLAKFPAARVQEAIVLFQKKQKVAA
jgi:hypothetical protein